MPKFELVSEYKPAGDQPQAIEKLSDALLSGKKYNTLLGVTGSGKTFTIANVIAKIGKSTLVISHNKTLAAQLYREFKEFFPHNAVEYFISYYDYYQPEAYVPHTDTYIEKDASINEDLDRLRLAATMALSSRDDVIIVSSVSCIYNLGEPSEYEGLLLVVEKGKHSARDEILKKLIDIRYERNDIDFSRGKFRARGDVIEIFPAYEQIATRVELSGDLVIRISDFNPTTGDIISDREKIAIYPAGHFVTTKTNIEKAVITIKKELKDRASKLKLQGKLLEAERILSRTRYDIEMLKEMGYCHGIENYSSHISSRISGSRPYCLIDYFKKDFLLVIDESHVTVPQIRGMYEGDRSRKNTLVDFGFRLPSCLDNRPLKFDEFEGLVNQAIFVSATPTEYETKLSKNIIEQIIRPTGLIDPEIIVKPSAGQIADIISEIKKRAKRNERVLATTLTKRMSEDLTAYLKEEGLKVKYLHSEINAIERVKILHDLRKGEFDCLVGVNLLREGLDLPEVSLVAVLDADKEGFLRSETSLIQVSGRAARNINGCVIMYADTLTKSMKNAISETNRRRAIQLKYNKDNSITPASIVKAVKNYLAIEHEAKSFVLKLGFKNEEEYELNEIINDLERDMELAARNLHFEEAAALRDQIKLLKGKYKRNKVKV